MHNVAQLMKLFSYNYKHDMVLFSMRLYICYLQIHLNHKDICKNLKYTFRLSDVFEKFLKMALLSKCFKISQMNILFISSWAFLNI